jgi:hypothetical protein
MTSRSFSRMMLFASALALAPIARPAWAQTPPGSATEPTETTVTAGTMQDQAAAAPAQAPAADADDEELRPFRLGGEAKINFRHSRDLRSRVSFPFPPEFLPPGQSEVFLRTVSPGASLELSNVALIGEGDLTKGVSAKIEVHFLDLHNRNPTSSDDRILLREAWVRFGRTFDPLQPVSGTSFYVLAGVAPRFTKPRARRLESYGMWTTAVARFEQPQLQLGGTFGRFVYWRAMAGNGNPLFIRDTNALAGDNGTPERVPGSTVTPIYESGFPILYDAKMQDLNPNGRFEYGFGGGVRAAGERAAVDVMGWMFRRDLAETARIRGTFYSGDLKLLRGAGFPLPFSGNDKIERGVNIEARAAGLRLWGQYVDQEIAKLPRSGYEIEAAYRIRLDGWFLVGETPIGQWIQPAVRWSMIDNQFDGPREYPAPSVDWDWTKLDLGVRLGLTQHVDVTAEYSINRMETFRGWLDENETLVTLRVGF